MLRDMESVNRHLAVHRARQVNRAAIQSAECARSPMSPTSIANSETGAIRGVGL